MSQLARMTAEITKLQRLPKNWDSYGARPVSAACASRAVDLLAKFTDADIPRPCIVPMSTGGLQVEWHENGVEIEIYIEPNSPIYFWAEEGSTCNYDMPLIGNENRLKTWLKRLKKDPASITAPK